MVTALALPLPWLFTPAEASGSSWELDLQVAPPEVAAADC
jgi:hypothetical protein